MTGCLVNAEVGGMSRFLVEHGFNVSQGRLLLADRDSCYHVVTRAPFGYGAMEEKGPKEMFVKQLHRQAGFSGIEILAYCFMSNHIHLLVRVPHEEDEALTDKVLLNRYYSLYGGEYVPESSYTYEEVEEIFRVGGAKAERLRRALRNRMGDLSVFMRELKQRFTFWYNSAFNNKGSIWGGRFKSQLIENDLRSLALVSAYIDLNPVRAKLVSDPGDYRYSSYGASMRGDGRARGALMGIYSGKNWDEVIAAYCLLLFDKGSREKKVDALKPEKDRGTISAERAHEVCQSEGKVGIAEAMHYRLRAMTEAGALGSRSFIELVSVSCQKQLSGNRKYRGHALTVLTGADRDDDGLYTLRKVTTK